MVDLVCRMADYIPKTVKMNLTLVRTLELCIFSRFFKLHGILCLQNVEKKMVYPIKPIVIQEMFYSFT